MGNFQGVLLEANEPSILNCIIESTSFWICITLYDSN